MYEGWRWPSFADGAAAMRTLAQAGLLPTVHPALRRGRDRDQPGPTPTRSAPTAPAGCLMIAGYEGDPGRGRGQAGRGHRGARPASAAPTSARSPGEAWAHGRFDAPYLRDSMLDVGVLVETLETATFWSNVDRLYADVKAALEASLGAAVAGALPHLARLRDRLLALLHGRRARRPTTRSRSGWRAKAAASDAIIAAGATITHHHAVGTDHKPWLAAGDRRRSASRSCARSRPSSTRPASSTRGC